MDLRVSAGADLADVTLMMADYNLTALAVTDGASNLIGAISVDDIVEALVPEAWRNRVEASSGV
ncbi:MAG: CBS domain-containing protein [Chloroflexi bacterium]|nr:MAG: CBS domain-containing protein [Chloroflexota bacterium]